MALSYQEIGIGSGVPTSPEAQPFPLDRVIFEPRLVYNSPVQARDMGLHSGVDITPEQEGLYIDLRSNHSNGIGPVESDQVLMAKVLEQTGGPVDVFEAAYPNIHFPKNPQP